MSRHATPSRMDRRSPRAAFTLIELLIVIVIIAMMSALFLGALEQADQKSRIARTKSTIQKLHNVIMARWDAYRTLRLPISADARGAGTFANAGDEFNSKFREDVARRRMFAMRELLRMEMPDRYDDLQFIPTVLIHPVSKAPIRPFLWNAYNRKIDALFASYTKDSPNLRREDFIARIAEDYQSAECLYLIMTTGVDDSSTSTEHFSVREVGDADRDGMLEFHDSWGFPIEFLRWAPGFESAMQPYYRYDTRSDPKAQMFNDKSGSRDPDDPSIIVSRWKIQIDRATETNIQVTNRVVNKLILIDQDDPFNPMRVGPIASTSSSGSWVRSTRWRPGDAGPEHGYILIPLIYSYGPDGKSGIQHCVFDHKIEFSPTKDAPSPDGGSGTISDSDPYNRYQDTRTGVLSYRGSSTRQGYDYDNIHNQSDQSGGN